MLNQKRNLSLKVEWLDAVFAVAEKEDLCVNLVYAEYVLENWQIEAKSRELKNHHGKAMDPISDMLIQIKNAQAVFHPTVEIPFSNLKYEIAKILEKKGFIEKVEKKGKKVKRTIEITLKYLPSQILPSKTWEGENKTPAISGLKRISKTGQRIYTPAKKIKKVRGGYGIAIISTSKGLMTDKEARKQKLGGEVICEVW